MHDNWLIAFAMGIAALGTAGLLFALAFLEAPLAHVDEVRQAADGTPLRVQGEVLSVQERSGITIITISQDMTLDLVLFSNGTGLRSGDCIIASGKRASYNDNAQLSTSRILRC